MSRDIDRISYICLQNRVMQLEEENDRLKQHVPMKSWDELYELLEKKGISISRMDFDQFVRFDARIPMEIRIRKDIPKWDMIEAGCTFEEEVRRLLMYDMVDAIIEMFSGMKKEEATE